MGHYWATNILGRTLLGRTLLGSRVLSFFHPNSPFELMNFKQRLYKNRCFSQWILYGVTLSTAINHKTLLVFLLYLQYIYYL